ncbi:MAG: methyltransferase [Pseudonocardiaceae bacterium]|nr:methyltransferase [Pseudonocardiaceae bacterium]
MAREESERFKPFRYDEIVARDKANLDITWLRDPALDDGDDLLPPEVIAQEIVDDLQAALSEFAAVAEALQATRSGEVTDPTPGRGEP